MTEPRASRPHMPGYGILGPGEGAGLLPWSWAEERLSRSHDYWVATVRSNPSPHLMPVWGVWHEAALWFSSSNGSRKATNLASNPRCAVSTDSADEPVVVEGTAELVIDREMIAVFANLIDMKYLTSYGADFYDPAVNSTFRLPPTWAFGLTQNDFTGSPTRWIFIAPEPSDAPLRGLLARIGLSQVRVWRACTLQCHTIGHSRAPGGGTRFAVAPRRAGTPGGAVRSSRGADDGAASESYGQRRCDRYVRRLPSHLMGSRPRRSRASRL